MLNLVEDECFSADRPRAPPQADLRRVRVARGRAPGLKRVPRAAGLVAPIVDGIACSTQTAPIINLLAQPTIHGTPGVCAFSQQAVIHVD